MNIKGKRLQKEKFVTQNEVTASVSSIKYCGQYQTVTLI